MGLPCQVLEGRPGAGAAHPNTPSSTPCYRNAQFQHSSYICLQLRPRSEGLIQLPGSPSRVFWRRSRCGSGEAARGCLGLSSPAADQEIQGCKLGSDVGNFPPLNAALQGCLACFCSAWGRGGGRGGFCSVAGAQGGCRDLQSVVLPLESCVFLGECFCLFPCLCWAGADSSSSRDDAGAGGWRGEDQV